MTQDGGMLSTKQEEDLCGCCADVQTLWVWIWARAKWPDYYWWVHVKDIKATLLHRENRGLLRTTGRAIIPARFQPLI